MSIPSTDAAVIVADALNRLRGGGWTASGTRVQGPGTMAVDVTSQTDHVGQAGMAHLDLTFLLNVDRPDSAIIDCIAGVGTGADAAVEQAIGSWITTTASAIFEVIEHQGTHASHFPPASPMGMSNWHCVGGMVSVYGHGEEGSVLAEWFSDTVPWVAIEDAIITGIDRPMLNGIKLYVGGSGQSSFAEVRINGVVNETASAALLALPWPRSERLAFARTYLIALPPG